MIRKFISYNNQGEIGTTLSTNDKTLVLDESVDWLELTDYDDADKIVARTQDFKIKQAKGELSVTEKTSLEKKEFEEKNNRRKVANLAQAQRGAITFGNNLSSVQDITGGSSTSTKDSSKP